MRAVAIGTSLVTFVLSIALLADFDKATAGYQFVESKGWIESLGIRYLMGVDGISLFMVVLGWLMWNQAGVVTQGSGPMEHAA